MTPRPRDVVCFSQLRWDFVYQRPQHLMTRFARTRRVWFFEEPVWEPGPPRLLVEGRAPNVTMVRPVLPHGMDQGATDAAIADMVADLVWEHGIEGPIAWFYTPMAIPWAAQLDPTVTVYDCMDELSAFRGAPPELRDREARLFDQAQVVFTGGHSLYEAKRSRHPNVHEFPSAVDVDHFGQARSELREPADQVDLPHPRVGWFGVIDERTDLPLLAGIADLRPAWSFVLVGPTVKIDPASVPQRPNIVNFGMRRYEELPAYITGWDVAMMPFARNESTRFISPTKTPEYLAAGRPVVSTSIADVIEPYARLGLARIADTPAEFIAACEAAMAESTAARLAKVDRFLADRSWDRTFAGMNDLVERAVRGAEGGVAVR